MGPRPPPQHHQAVPHGHRAYPAVVARLDPSTWGSSVMSGRHVRGKARAHALTASARDQRSTSISRTAAAGSRYVAVAETALITVSHRVAVAQAAGGPRPGQGRPR